MSDQAGQDVVKESNDEDVLLDAFLEGPLILGNISLRPYSAGTLLLAKKLDLKLALYGGNLDVLTQDELWREIEAYVWMQHEDIYLVMQAIRFGVWRTSCNGYLQSLGLRGQSDDQDRDHEINAMVILHLQQQATLIQATRVKLSGGKTTAPNIFHPCWMARLIHMVSQNKGWGEDWVTWYLPYARALQYEHCQLRTMGWKTLRAGAASNCDAAAEMKKAEEQAEKQAAAEDEEW